MRFLACCPLVILLGCNATPSATDTGPAAGDASAASDAAGGGPDVASDDGPYADVAADAPPPADVTNVPDVGTAPDASTAQDGGIGYVCTGAPASFASDLTPILHTSCSGGELCHSGLADPWPYSSLVNAPITRDMCPAPGVIVSPGSLEQSYLMNKLTGIGMCPMSARMPKIGQPLPPAQIQLFADWICNGAPNN
jgi:hypothetical protein